MKDESNGTILSTMVISNPTYYPHHLWKEKVPRLQNRLHGNNIFREKVIDNLKRSDLLSRNEQLTSTLRKANREETSNLRERPS